MRHMSPPDTNSHPTGTVTFLFTDIEGSTGRWETQTAEMGEALARHDDTLRTTVEAHGGWMFKHTGDGVLAAFPSPNGAVQAAIEAQRALELPARMGIATGEAELRGDDYFGPTLNRAARVMAAGHGGQVLVANSTAGIVTGVDLLDLGERRLRDLSGPQRIFQVLAEGLREKFPPLRTVDTVPGNLRSQATSFIGRESEITELVEAVRANRLVTLTGVGGVGKTRLALQVAAELVPDFPEGVFVVELVSVGDPAAVPDAVANALGIVQQPRKSVTESVAEAVAGRYRLLVLDNCEHVLDAAANIVEAIFERSKTVKVLATSREGLRLSAEHLWPVPSLAVSDGEDSPGVRLFVERARAASPRFTLDREADALAVVEICRRLDGIPLAIELAAARMLSMRPAEVRDRLGDRFRLLAGGRRGLERHQTLRHAVQWSYDLLDPHEHLLLNRCSVFAGGFDLDGAVAVGGGGELDEYAVLDLLDALVRKSLLTAEAAGDAMRYGMLETIRQFAVEQLAFTGSSDEVRDLHARYFVRKENSLIANRDGPKLHEASHWLEREMANLRAAFRWSSSRGDLDSAAAIAIYGSLIGYASDRWEPVAWAEELLEPARAAEHGRLATLYLMASFCGWGGRVAEGIAYAESALKLLDGPGHQVATVGGSYVWVASAYGVAGRFDKMIPMFEREIASSGDGLRTAAIGIGQALFFSGRSEEGMARAVAAVAVAEAGGNPGEIAYALFVYGQAHATVDPFRAKAAMERGLAVARAGEVRSWVNRISSALAGLEATIGDPRKALGLFGAAIDGLYDAGNITTLLGQGLGGLAVALDRLGHHDAAATLIGFTGQRPNVRGFAEAEVHLRSVLGDETFERLSREGAALELADAVRYAHEQIRLAREELEGTESS
jgi:predicted ATPase/class 3 adenylate cyclase